MSIHSLAVFWPVKLSALSSANSNLLMKQKNGREITNKEKCAYHSSNPKLLVLLHSLNFCSYFFFGYPSLISKISELATFSSAFSETVFSPPKPKSIPIRDCGVSLPQFIRSTGHLYLVDWSCFMNSALASLSSWILVLKPLISPPIISTPWQNYRNTFRCELKVDHLQWLKNTLVTKDAFEIKLTKYTLAIVNNLLFNVVLQCTHQFAEKFLKINSSICIFINATPHSERDGKLSVQGWGLLLDPWTSQLTFAQHWQTFFQVSLKSYVCH